MMPLSMKTTLTRESASKVKVAVEASPEEVAPAVERAVRKLAKEVNIPGFRKGHAPRKVLESRIGRDAIRDAALREAIPELVGKAVETEQLVPIAPPAVDVTTYELDAELIFDATVEIRPDIELPEWDLLSATRPSTVATSEEIDQQMERLRERFATLETVERPAATGDHALIDISTSSLLGSEIKELTGTDQLYEVGSSFPVPDLDQQLEGSKAGDILKFNATLPEGLEVEHAGQEVAFQVLVKEVRRKVMPDLNDEFAKTASEFDTFDELRADVADRIQKVKEIQADADVRNVVLEQALQDVEIEAPESLVNEEMVFRLRRMEEQLNAGGVTLEQYMQAQNISEEKLEQDLREQADRNVKAQLLLEEIGKKEGFTITEEELRDEVRYHAETLRTDPNQLAKQLQDRGRLTALAGDILRRKALNHLVEKAEITQEGATGTESTQEGEKS
jgi:trigger factor